MRSTHIGRYIESSAGQLLQLARSTPLLVGTLVGHKHEDHVRENIQLVKQATISSKSFEDLALQLDV